jgi:ABC-type sugar transport system permease subunit
MIAVSMIWYWMYEPSHGMINKVLGLFNIPSVRWLFDVRSALPAIIIMSIWKLVGYYMVIYLAGLQSIPQYLYEAATVDGARSVQKFFHITLPMLRPVTFFLFVTGVIFNFKVFEQVLMLTDGGPLNSTTTVVHQIYNRAFIEFHLGYASAEAFFVLVVIAALTLVFFKYGSRKDETEIG